MAEAPIPQSVEVREAVFGGITLRLHFTDDGRRIIEAAGMQAVMKAMQAGTFPVNEALRAMQWAKGDG